MVAGVRNSRPSGWRSQMVPATGATPNTVPRSASYSSAGTWSSMSDTVAADTLISTDSRSAPGGTGRLAAPSFAAAVPPSGPTVAGSGSASGDGVVGSPQLKAAATITAKGARRRGKGVTGPPREPGLPPASSGVVCHHFLRTRFGRVSRHMPCRVSAVRAYCRALYRQVSPKRTEQAMEGKR